MIDTDRQWEIFGEKEPYFGVLANTKYRLENLNEEALCEFFESGQRHLSEMLETINEFSPKRFQPVRCLDFGCGVGRLILPMAKVFPEVVGVDISKSMIMEAQRNCGKIGIKNATFFMTDTWLSQGNKNYDFIHTYIVFQHIPPKKGEKIIKKLLDSLNQNGVATLHFTYAWETSLIKKVLHWAQGEIPGVHQLANLLKGRSLHYPFMRMFNYNLGRILEIVDREDTTVVKKDFVKHGEHLGVIIYLQKNVSHA